MRCADPRPWIWSPCLEARIEIREIVGAGGPILPPLLALNAAVRLGCCVYRVPSLGGPAAMLLRNLIIVADPACFRWLQFVVAHEIAHWYADRTDLLRPRVGAWFEHQMDAVAAGILSASNNWLQS